MTAVDLKKQFHQKMIEIYNRAAKECGYRATRFLELVDKRGGFEAARDLLHAAKPAEGLTKLWELGRLDLSMEALVCEDPWWSLFSEEEVAIAEKRLRDLGFSRK